ncbi:uncharacterized protein MYU51_014597 [Penicillium brevicompactum]|uniref:uncharacterized protein n=1 Tax=Penicillium brevicompactum TaxID=5074 RepID=UPI00253FB189|nr:uncharacterized protein N7506_009686 [Penicillium brevicompactum]KAJ5326584.1 hypothetical protein N7506_009686 [Penicillium brevicompactum]
MTPQITEWDDLDFVQEDNDSISEIARTSFGLVDNETFYYGHLGVPRAEISLEQINAALMPIPSTIYPIWPMSEANLRLAPDDLAENFYIKRPKLETYNWLVNHGQGLETQLFKSLVAEAQVLEELSQHPRPNLIRYYGSRVAHGHFTGIVLEKHPRDLQTHIDEGHKVLDKNAFMGALESAIQHLHDLGFAHNDLCPANVLVSETGMPVLIDFEGCQKLGTLLQYIRGTEGWIDGEIKDHHTSDTVHDTFALGKIQAWLESV